MKIAVLLDDRGFSGINLTTPEQGNPGIGGTPYCFQMLMCYYPKKYPENEFVVYLTAQNGNTYKQGINTIYINNLDSLLSQCEKDAVDILVITSTMLLTFESQLKTARIKVIVWAHNFLLYRHIRMIRSCECIKRVCFVGKEQYERYIDDPIINKSTYILNMFDTKNEKYVGRNVTKPIVTYVGSLVKGKGFHVLAKEWKNILKKVPNAELYVLGSGKLYNNKAQLGKYGLAGKAYEDQFVSYLLDAESRIIPSVHFMGIVGSEKIDIYKATKVGVVNPTGRTEICSISTIEMSTCGVPVVSRFANGMPDVIENSQTGYLAHSNRQFRKRVISLLNNEKLNRKMSKNAVSFVQLKFAPEIILEQWNELFDDVYQGKQSAYMTPSNNWSNNLKWIRYISRVLHKIPVIKRIPSVAIIESYVKEKIV